MVSSDPLIRIEEVVTKQELFSFSKKHQAEQSYLHFKKTVGRPGGDLGCHQKFFFNFSLPLSLLFFDRLLVPSSLPSLSFDWNCSTCLLTLQSPRLHHG
jgi:hypothetical protein